MIAESVALAAIAGTSIAAGARAWPLARSARRTLRPWRREQRRALTPHPPLAPPLWSRARDTTIAGILGNLLRSHDGSFIKAYHLESLPTTFARTEMLEQRADEIARLLALPKPPGTVLQFRLACQPDPGKAVAHHLQTRDQDTPPLATMLHTLGLSYYQELAAAGAFKDYAVSLWIKIPVRHHRDHALKHAPHTKRRRVPNPFSTRDQIIRRLARDEQQARAEAEKTFRAIERQSPIRLTAFTEQELWAAVFLGHRQNASSVPLAPTAQPGRDLRDYLCGESIVERGYYLLHGRHPAAIVSVFTPPQPLIYADCMRALTINPELSFRHTLVTEYVYPDQHKAQKRLDKRIRQLRRALHGSPNLRRSENFEGQRALEELSAVRQTIVGNTEALVEARCYAVVYGPPAYTPEELHASVRELNQAVETVVAAIRRIPGADADREEPAALATLYPKTLVGELTAAKTGREVLECAASLSPLAPLEMTWRGTSRAHTLCATPTGHLIGFDLYNRTLVSSPLALIIAASGGGKSVLLSRIICDILASRRGVRVRAADYGHSQEPLSQVLGARHIRFDEHRGEPRTINIWDYPGLERAQPPDALQISFVVGDLAHLARVPADDTTAEDILTLLVKECYRNQVPRNRPGRPKQEPQLSHLLDLLRVPVFKEDTARRRAETLRISLETFRNDPWLDAPTHPDFLRDSQLDVYEFDSIEFLPERVKASLAYRIAAQIMHALSFTEADGTHPPVLLAFDEMHILGHRFPGILSVIERAARTGRKQNAVTILASQAYEDFCGTPETPNPAGIALCSNAGVKFIGKQNGNYDRLVSDSQLSPTAGSAIAAIRNLAGHHAQFLAVFGAGEDKTVEMLQLDLSPTELWTYTTNPEEKNARARLQALRPDWSALEVIAILAERYPRGLVGESITTFDDTLGEPQ